MDGGRDFEGHLPGGRAGVDVGDGARRLERVSIRARDAPTRDRVSDAE
jgi:hypothetical protein